MKLLVNSTVFLALGDIENIFGPVMKLIGQMGFALAFIGLILGGYRWMTHDHSEAKKALLAAAFVAGAGTIATYIFHLMGSPVITISQ